MTLLMQAQISKLLAAAVSRLQDMGDLPADLDADTRVQRTRDKSHGDFTTNLALRLSGPVGMPASILAGKIAEHIPECSGIAKIETADPGFINFYMHDLTEAGILDQIIDGKEHFGCNPESTGKKVLIEFVSANPTGPLHIGHGRGAAYGATIANLLEAAGCEVQREYYVNDTGRQADILTVSVWLRYLELCGQILDFPASAYQGDYIWDIAAAIHREHAESFLHPAEAWIRAHENGGKQDDAEAYVDMVIERAKSLLTQGEYETLRTCALDTISRDIRDDLERFAVTFDRWYSELSLTHDKVQAVLDTLAARGHTYRKDGALWFRSTTFDDAKDRVLVRENGQPTYFASDIAYHLDKYERGYDRLINIWGADHHGYVPRMLAAMQALGKDPGRLSILLVQFANLFEGGEKLAMSTRSGEFLPLRQLRKQVGKDAARFFYVMRKCEQHLDFDLDLATSQTQDNPVYYVQYAHARICGILRQADPPVQDEELATSEASLLVQEQEKNLIKHLARFPESVQAGAEQLAPHVVVSYLRNLANSFHSFYNAHQVLVSDPALRSARLKLARAAQIVLGNGLALLDVSAPERM